VRHVFRNARINSFEPLPGPAAALLRVFAGDAPVRLHPYAIADPAGTTQMNVSGCDDSSSLLPIAAEQAWLATDVFVAPGVVIGAGTVVGARSSVFKSLPAGVIARGSPVVAVRARERVQQRDSSLRSE
jgi:UDP-3-O-[3-hydroxymyristoyl] glucosamine N-acyltransferase